MEREEINELMDKIESVLKKEGKVEYRKLRKMFSEYNSIDYYKGVNKLKRSGKIKRVTEKGEVSYKIVREDDV